MEAAGAKTEIVSPNKTSIRGFNLQTPGDEIVVEIELKVADPVASTALLQPGGVMDSDTLRARPAAVSFTKVFFAAGKPVAAICHGPPRLIAAGVVRGRQLASIPSLTTDLHNAGAKWVDLAVVVDAGLVTSRTPDDIIQFNEKMVGECAAGRRAVGARA